MRKIPVVLGSVLKPVDDTRMYEKLGITLAETNNYEVNIIGFSSKNISGHENLKVHPVFSFSRTSIKRILAPWTFLRSIIKVKPEVVIVNTYELLGFSILYKIIYSKKIIYDVIENYALNVLYNPQYHYLVRAILAFLIRSKETLLAPFVNHFILAEKSYRKEIGFVRRRYTILENKYKPLMQETTSFTKPKDRIRLLFSGTISETYGIFSTIDFVKKLHKYNRNFELLIIGYCATMAELKHIKSQIAHLDFINLKGGDELVPHCDIIEAIRTSDFGIVNYQINKSNQNCYPTRIYEYLGNRLPILIQDYKPWYLLPLSLNACLIVDFENPDVENLFDRMQKVKFYTKPIPKEIFWKEEGEILKKIVSEIF